MIESYINLELFTFGDLVIRLGGLLGFVLVITLSLIVYKKVIKVYLPRFYKFFNISKVEGGDFKNIIRNVIILIAVQILVTGLDWDFVFFRHKEFYLSIGLIIKVLLIYQISSLLIWGVDNIIHSFYLGRQPNTKEEIDHDIKKENSIISNIRSIIYFSATISVVKATNLNFQYTTGLTTEQLSDDINISVVKILSAILIILIARFIVWILTQFILFNIYNKKRIPFAQRFAINQLILYVVYVLAIFIALHYILGSKMTILYGGAAALLVGVGLGLQQTFNDFFSGLVLLFERSVGVGDVIEVEGQIGRVAKIGLRSSLIKTRDATTIVVPNSKMVNLNVQNISHEYELTRFGIKIEVAYGSDTALVSKLLIESLEGVEKVLTRPAPSIRFDNFGLNGLEFRLLFYTKELFRVEQTKSDIRFNIDALFRANDIDIPFQQQTVWIKKEKV